MKPKSTRHTAPDIRIGIGGWTYEPWRGRFYPEGLTQKRELEYASRALNSIEINGTFYGTQRATSFEKWHDETPDDFVFALKAPRFATHRRVLAEAGDSVEHFFSSGVLALKNKLGPINWQFAPTKRFDAEDFDGFLRLLPKRVGGHIMRHAVEVRHESFRHPEFVSLAREHGVAIVVAGDSDHPQIADVTAPFVYVRIMGTVETEALGYSEQALTDWSTRARQWADGGAPENMPTIAPALSSKNVQRDVYLYVIGGYKVLNPAAAMALIERTRNGAD
ncbi:DUF72 domain-containing protein [Trinickia caryophylli]|uniref:Uncharacterized conserved protein YecE, DUF72 family n=1 Tax=Trinickia caryophylli TaxID=28094 RepID=A0A1X7G2V4_TRICW|nr:DUF72 domain-containing protein [Trinickia caryophylli]PMS13726.1 DUF72 domain-containing protein [Trinickia caryophylli]TRX14219.1 DUF72 domain-containing protein [Trinickia caryophylli]WQE14045.1 DUF72 domain-containing protein [Trinickia caryophylli]SMF63054.1 Uncharacterized conserved protein YecE, DUF72 family [Trinickia caryophylli]GLU33466.1 hypothetical protein Busp01_33080 [Trinickia caryophylli]